MITTVGYAAVSATTPLKPWRFELRDVGNTDVLIDILYCGVCHSDIHFAKNDWLQTIYPVVPGHEIVGRVVQIGKDVVAFKPDDYVAVGVVVESCGVCPRCKAGEEPYCEKGFTMTFNSFDPHTKGVTYGGYAKQMVVDEKYVFALSKELRKHPLDTIAPLLCAGITVYSPLKHWGIGHGKTVGVIGIGGLGHLAVKMAHAMGSHVIAITSTPDKLHDLKRLGADEGALSTDQKSMQTFLNRCDFLINTLPVAHDLNAYIPLLAFDGVMCLVGIPSHPHPNLYANLLVEKRRSISGSLVGGIPETGEMLDFCAENNIVADVERIAIQDINQAFPKVVDKEVRYRYVVDLSTLKG
jgi:uncharacterized zinc-type alcohol dehydrogenase-like protein